MVEPARGRPTSGPQPASATRPLCSARGCALLVHDHLRLPLSAHPATLAQAGARFAGQRYRVAPVALLRFTFGTMGSGKSTVALQIHHNLASRDLQGCC